MGKIFKFKKRILRIKCAKCGHINEATSICKLVCTNCGHIHDCGEGELLNPAPEDKVEWEEADSV